MKKKSTAFAGIFFLFLILFYLIPAIIDFSQIYMRYPDILLYQVEGWFYQLGQISPIFMVAISAIIIAAVVWVCQKIEDKKLESETDFIQAEHLCESNDENMQDYTDAAEKRAQKQQRLSNEIYGKRPPQSKYYKR